MLRILAALAVMAGPLVISAHAGADEDELVRLPNQGKVRDSHVRDRVQADRLKPGGGLFVTFDSDQNGRISPQEVQLGIPRAFAIADANEDGNLTALEQQAWARQLPTQDDTLANPVRFDPNLDRNVDLSEFSAVIQDLSLAYADEISGEIIIASLKIVMPDTPRLGDKENDNHAPRRGDSTQPDRHGAKS